MRPIEDYRRHVGMREGTHHKATLFRSDRLLLGLNCLEPGQSQAVHRHAGQDKFYLVMEGRGKFTVGRSLVEAGPGEIVWAAAEEDHGVENQSAERLVLVVGIAPAPLP
ncbi:MAG: cupin domain-containing protein [Gemmatimonadota bacterium]